MSAKRQPKVSFIDVLAEELRKDLRDDMKEKIRDEVRSELIREFGLSEAEARASNEIPPGPVSARERLELWLSANLSIGASRASNVRAATRPARGYQNETRRNEVPKSAPIQNRSESPKAEPRKAHLLDVEDTAAIEFFRREGCELSTDFTVGELKTAYRKLALKLHPDRHSGDDEVARRRWDLRFQQLVAVTERLTRHF